MPILFLLCGLPGAGKTTLARELERTHHAFTLNTDAWMVPLFGQHMPRDLFDARLAQVQALQWGVAKRLLALGVNVVLDWGFWTREQRNAARRQGRAWGADVQLYFLDVDIDELRRRLRARTLDLPSSTFELDDAALDLFARGFEPPEDDEAPARRRT